MNLTVQTALTIMTPSMRKRPLKTTDHRDNCYLTGSPGPVIAVSPQLGSRYTWGNLRWQLERALRCAICRAGGGLFTMIRHVVLSGHGTESGNCLLRVRRESTFSLPGCGVSLSWGLVPLLTSRAPSSTSS